jgi:hypothetical protein
MIDALTASRQFVCGWDHKSGMTKEAINALDKR